jgi:NADPH:quinone reductase-like Zn-dependent oxidoreductase
MWITPAEPGPQVRVRNQAIGLNFIDTYFRSGLYAPPALPSSLGTEGAGVVDAVGSEVTQFKVGDRVAYGTGPLGPTASCMCCPPRTWCTCRMKSASNRPPAPCSRA